jgi:hypothetical protein
MQGKTVICIVIGLRAQSQLAFRHEKAQALGVAPDRHPLPRLLPRQDKLEREDI